MCKMNPLALVALSVFLLPSAAAAKKTTGTGAVAVRGGDSANACDKALRAARRDAVEKAIGVSVESTTKTKNFQLLKDEILSRANGFISAEKKLSENLERGTCTVVIEAEVHQANVDKDLRAKKRILEGKGMPNVLIMVSEQNIGGGESAWWKAENPASIDLGAVENTLMDALGEQGFTFVDRQALTGTIAVGNALGSALDTQTMKSMATNAGADVVIYGKAFAVDKGEIMGTKMRSAQANISLRVLATDTSKIIATHTGNAGAGHIEPAIGGTKALNKVARQTAKALAIKIFSKWQMDIAGTATVSLVVKGVTKSKQARKLKTFIGNNIAGVQKVRQRSYRRKVAQYDVILSGHAQDLAEELEEKQFEGFALEIEEVTGDKVVAKIAPGN